MTNVVANNLGGHVGLYEVLHAGQAWRRMCEPARFTWTSTARVPNAHHG